MYSNRHLEVGTCGLIGVSNHMASLGMEKNLVYTNGSMVL